MTDQPTGRCVVCGTLGRFHINSVDADSGATSVQSYCLDHMPSEYHDKVPFGPHKTAADEVSLLRTKLASLDAQVIDTSLREQIRADVEQLIADIESGKRRLSDLA